MYIYPTKPKLTISNSPALDHSNSNQEGKLDRGEFEIEIAVNAIGLKIPHFGKFCKIFFAKGNNANMRTHYRITLRASKEDQKLKLS